MRPSTLVALSLLGGLALGGCATTPSTAHAIDLARPVDNPALDDLVLDGRGSVDLVYRIALYDMAPDPGRPRWLPNRPLARVTATNETVGRALQAQVPKLRECMAEAIYEGDAEVFHFDATLGVDSQGHARWTELIADREVRPTTQRCVVAILHEVEDSLDPVAATVTADLWWQSPRRLAKDLAVR